MRGKERDKSIKKATKEVGVEGEGKIKKEEDC